MCHVPHGWYRNVINLGRASISLCAIQSIMNTTQEVALVERLGQIADDPSLKRAGPNIITGIGGDQHGGNLFAQSRQMVVQIEATHLGHVEIDNQAAGAAQFGGEQELLPGRKCLGDQSYRAHQKPDCVPDRFVIIDYRNYWSADWHLAKPVTASGVSNADVVRETHYHAT
jgi:hypothetical protein